MRAAVCEKPQGIVIKEMSIPRPGDGEVLVKVKSAGICSSDMMVYRGTYPGIAYPIIPGHEFSGEVVAVGKNVNDFNVEDEVIVEPLFPCGECRPCLTGDYNLCEKQMMLGFQVPGSFAEYAIARSSMIYKKEPSLSFNEAALVEPLAVAVHAVKQARISIGDTVAVLGAGVIGLLVLQVAKRVGASVIITDIIAEKLHLAADLGADYVLNAATSEPYEMVMAMTKDSGADVVIECAGKPETMIQSANLIRKGGTIVIAGWTENKLDLLPLTRIAMNEVKLIGSMNYRRDFPIAIELASSRYINLNSIISHEFEFSEIGRAFDEISMDQGDIIKAVIRFSEQEI